MVLTMDAKRRLTVPVNLVFAQPGDIFEISVDQEENAIVFRRINRKADWLAVLEQCPLPIEDLPPRRPEYFRSKL
jgi:bifunctional DNA-binding transcriptional regulator/antitoxin component of YhaV-PrlF toxin-antitoxin module